MNVFITGATGFVGRALVARLQQDGHRVTAWVRDRERAAKQLGAGVKLVPVEDGDIALRRAVHGSDAVVNLAGEPIFAGRWTAARRYRLTDSRVGVTRRLVDAIASARKRPAVLVSASAIGLYGDRGSEWVDESSAASDDFLATLCHQWEQAALRARSAGTRVAIARIGIVLGAGGGALQKMVPPFRAFVGGPLGSGRQYVSWIHLHDLVEVLARAVTDDRYSGAFNAVSPDPVTNRELSKALGAALRRPSWLPVPAFVLRLLFGASAGALLASQRVAPRELGQLGFEYRFARVEDALQSLFGPDEPVSIDRPTTTGADQMPAPQQRAAGER